MPRPRVRLKSRGMARLLDSTQVRGDLTARAQDVLAQARATAPVRTGAYRDSLTIKQGATDRAVTYVGTPIYYAMIVEADHGVLARALDAAR